MSEPANNQAATPESPEPAPDLSERYKSMLASGERVLLVRHRHWLTIIDPSRWFLLLLVIGVALGIYSGSAPHHGTFGFLGTTINWIFVILIVIALLGIGWNYLEWRRERYIITTRRVIEAGGVINTHQRDTSLPMITDMEVGHPWLGRLVGYGEIDLLTASEAGTNKIKYLPDADGFKRTLLDAKHEHEIEVAGGGVARTAVAEPAAPAPATRPSGEEVDASITHLADMRDRGLITPAEFEEKKQEILDRL